MKIRGHAPRLVASDGFENQVNLQCRNPHSIAGGIELDKFRRLGAAALIC